MPVIWIIDAEQWPRALLRAELIERGYDAVGYVTVRDDPADAQPGEQLARGPVTRAELLRPARWVAGARMWALRTAGPQRAREPEVPP